MTKKENTIVQQTSGDSLQYQRTLGKRVIYYKEKTTKEGLAKYYDSNFFGIRLL